MRLRLLIDAPYKDIGGKEMLEMSRFFNRVLESAGGSLVANVDEHQNGKAILTITITPDGMKALPAILAITEGNILLPNTDCEQLRRVKIESFIYG